jgi:hypothetical protein
MDALLTPEARREIEALRAVRPRTGTWGVLVGHKRGFRFIVEKVFMAGGPDSVPDERLLAGLDGVWPGRTIGLIAVRPSAAFMKAVRGPAWFGKLFLRISGPGKAPVVRPSIVDFERAFFLAPVRFAPERKKERSHE